MFKLIGAYLAWKWISGESEAQKAAQQVTATTEQLYAAAKESEYIDQLWGGVQSYKLTADGQERE